MISSKEIDLMTGEEKLAAVDQILTSFSKHNADSPSPDWHQGILSERMRKVEAGDVEWLSLDEVKKSLADIA